MREVMARAGVSRTTVYLWSREGKFPKPVRVGTRMVAWREDEIEAWLKARLKVA